MEEPTKKSEEPTKKRVDESWKEDAQREKHAPAPAQPGGKKPAAAPVAGAGQAKQELPQAQFDLFVSGLGMEALVALGELPHPATRRQGTNLPQARYLIDLLGVIEQKTKGNLSTQEEQLLRDSLYQLRARYLAKDQAK